MSVLLSVMVPVYKAQDTLDRCVQSILAQLPAGGEIILVDDGSPDNSGALCDEWARRDDRITVRHQANGGAAAARNTALQTARGRYLQFVDADDELLPGLYEAVLPPLLDGAELCFFACRDDGRAAPNERIAPCSVSGLAALPPAEIKRYLFETGVFYAPYNKVFSRAALERSAAAFDPALPVNEDLDFNLRLLPACRGLVFLEQAFYLLHLENGASLSRGFRTDLLSSAQRVAPRLDPFLQSAGFAPERRRRCTDAYLAQSACRQFDIVTGRKGPFAGRKRCLAQLFAEDAWRRAILAQLAADPNRLPALVLRVCVRLRLAALLALLLCLRDGGRQ